MSEHLHQTTTDFQRNRRNGLWASAIFSIVGLAFFVFSAYIVVVLQSGTFDIADSVLMPVAFLMMLAGLVSFFLYRRDSQILAGWLLFLSICLPPIAAALVFTNFSTISIVYLVILAPILIGFVIPKEMRTWTTVTTFVAGILIVLVELWDPAFRIETTLVQGFANFVIALAFFGLLTLLAQSDFMLPDEEPDLDTRIRRATRIALIILVGNGISILANLLMIFQDVAWQLHLLTVVLIVVEIAMYWSWRTIRAGQPSRGAWIIIISIISAAVAASIIIADVGIVLGLSSAVFAFIVALQSFPTREVRRGAMAGIIGGIFAVIINTINLNFRLVFPQMQAFVPIVAVLIGLVAGFFVFRRALTGTIRTKLVASFVATILISLGITATTAIISAQTALENQIGGSFSKLADDQLSSINNFFLEQVGQLQVISGGQDLIEPVNVRNAAYSGIETQDLAQIQELDDAWVSAPESDPFILSIINPQMDEHSAAKALSDFLRRFPSHTEVILTDRYGANVAATARTSDYYQGDEGWWQSAWNDGEGAHYISQPEYDESAGVTAMIIAFPVIDAKTGQSIGVLRSTLQVDSLYSVFGQATIGETGYSVLWDNQGQVLFDPRAESDNSAALPEEVIDTITGHGHYEESTDEVAEHFDLITDQNGKDLIIGHATLHPEEGEVHEHTAYLSHLQEEVIDAVSKLEWTVLVRQETEEAFQSVSRLARNVTIISIIVVGIAIGASVLVSNLIARPIVQLTGTAEEIAAGDYTARAEIPTRDEVGLLAQTFNTMAGQIQETLGSQEQTIASRTLALETSTEVSRRLSTILDQERLVSEVVEQLRSAFGYYHAQIYLYDDLEQNLIMVGGTGDAGRSMLAREHKIERGRGLVGQAAVNNEIVLIPDVSTAEGWLPNPLLPDTRAEIAVPIAVGNQVIGVLDVQHNVVDGLSEQDSDLIQAIGNQVGIAIRNAQAYDRAQRQAVREAQIAAISQRIQAANSIDEVLQIAASELGAQMNAQSTSVEISAK